MQRTTPSEDWAWFAGIVDGEGSIANYRHRRADTGAMRYNWGVIVVNTDTAILDRCKSICTVAGAEYYFYQKASSRKQRVGSYAFTKPCYSLHIKKVDSVKLILPLLIPHLTGDKRARSIKLAEDIASHQSRVTTKREAPARDEAIV